MHPQHGRMGSGWDPRLPAVGGREEPEAECNPGPVIHGARVRRPDAPDSRPRRASRLLVNTRMQRGAGWATRPDSMGTGDRRQAQTPPTTQARVSFILAGPPDLYPSQ